MTLNVTSTSQLYPDGGNMDFALVEEEKPSFRSSSPSPRRVETWDSTSPFNICSSPQLDFLSFDIGHNLGNLLEEELPGKGTATNIAGDQSDLEVSSAVANLYAGDALQDVELSVPVPATLSTKGTDTMQQKVQIQSETTNAAAKSNCSDSTALTPLAYLEKILSGSTNCLEGLEVGDLADFGAKPSDTRSQTPSHAPQATELKTASGRFLHQKTESESGAASATALGNAISKSHQNRAGVVARGKAKGNSPWSHLSEEELKKLRRVKNRASVEKCRTKQRLRIEALQVEMDVLTSENRVLRKTVTAVDRKIHNICVQVGHVTGRRPRVTSNTALKSGSILLEF